MKVKSTDGVLYQSGQQMHSRHRHTKAISQAGLVTQSIGREGRQDSALRISRSSSRSKFMLNPSTYSKTSGKRNMQPTLLNKSSVNKASIHDHLETDARSLEDSPSAGFP